MRRLVLVPAGLLIGFVTAATVLTAGVLAEALAAQPGSSLGIARIISVLVFTLPQGDEAVAVVATAIWRALLWVCLAPLCLVAMVAEAAQLRSWRWMAGGTGALAALGPTVLRTMEPGGGTTPLNALEVRLSLLLLLSGAAGGTLFWLVAGRRDAVPR